MGAGKGERHWPSQSHNLVKNIKHFPEFSERLVGSGRKRSINNMSAIHATFVEMVWPIKSRAIHVTQP